MYLITGETVQDKYLSMPQKIYSNQMNAIENIYIGYGQSVNGYQ